MIAFAQGFCTGVVVTIGTGLFALWMTLDRIDEKPECQQQFESSDHAKREVRGL